MSTREEVREEIIKITREHLGVAPEKDIQDSDEFIKDLGADSLDTVELVMAFEEELKLEIPDTAAESLTTVGAAVDYVFKHRQQQAA